MTIPNEMRYIAYDSPGGPENLRIATGPVPALQASDILIKVEAAGINRPDIQQRKGLYPPPPGASPILGLEAAGTVVARGRDVEQVQLGERVTALCNGGAYAEYVAVPAMQCLPWPEGFTAVEAASLPETFFTVWSNLFDIGRLSKSDILLVHGGTSGIGVTAIQLAKTAGATVYSTAGSSVKCAACLELGADAAINYHEADFEKELDALTRGKGVSIILDIVGAPYFQKNLSVLQRGGRLVSIAFMRGSKGEFDLLPITRKQLTIAGSTLRPRTVSEKGEIAKELYNHAWPLLSSRKIKPIVYDAVPWTKMALAHELMESSNHIGKIVVEMI